MASTSTKSAYEGKGAGGKLRKKPNRAPSTPYTRPIPSIGRILKDYVTDPAKKIASRTAHNLFSALYRKRLTAPPVIVQDAARMVFQSRCPSLRTRTADPGAQVGVSSEQDTPSIGRSSKGINEIEEVLLKKTFTRAEVDRLTQLLQSKTVNIPADNDRRRPEPTTLRAEATHEYRRHADYSLQTNKVEYQRSLGDTQVTPANSSVFKSNVASAADLAKAYMVSAPLNTSPSNLGLRSQPFRNDVPLLANAPYTPKPSGALLTPNSAADFSENGYTTRRTRGRSAIYNMARTPNFRIHDTAIRKIDGYVASSSQWSRENNTVSNGKQAIKRRSSILDSDIGSIGPIRRVRQKTDMMSPPRNSHTLSIRSPSLSGKADGFDIVRDPKSARQKQMFLNGSMDSTSNTHLAENGDNSILDSASVPLRSSKIAERILQQLEKSVPSPKEKLSELKLVVAREKSPTKLTHKMLNGKALRSLEDIDSSKLLKDDRFVVSNGKQSREARASTSHKQDEFDNGKPSPKENGGVKSWKENIATVKTSDSAGSSLSARPSEKKRAFRMSAHEDFLELDDDSDSEGAGQTTVKGKLDISSVDTKEVAVKPRTAENNSSETESSTSFAVKETQLSKTPVMKEDTDAKVDIASTTAEKNASFTFPGTPASSTTAQLTSPTPQPSMFSNGASPPKETSSAQNVSFAPKSVDKASPFKFSTQSDSPFNTKSEPKLTETSTTNVAVTVSATDVPQVPKSEGQDRSQKSRDLFGRPESQLTASTSATTTANIFSSGPPKLDNGPFSVPSLQPISTTAQVSDGNSNAIFSAATSTTTTVSPATTTITTDATTNPSPAFPQFGSNSIAAPLEPPKDKPASPSPFGSTSIPSFGASSSSSGLTFGFNASSTASTTSNLLSSSTTTSPFGTNTGASTTPNPFGTSTGTTTTPNPFGTSTGASTTSNPFGTSTGLSSTPNPFGTSTKTEAAPVTSFGTSTKSEAAPSNPFGTSTGPLFGSTKTEAAPVNPFGTSGSLFGSTKTEAAPVNPFGTSGSLFGSTKTEAAPVTPSFPTFGQTTSSSSSLSSGTSVFGSTPTPTPSIFGSSSVFGSSASTSPSVFGSGFGSTTSTSGLVFGGGAPPATSAPAPTTSLFGSSTTSPAFSFITPAAPTTTSTPPFGTSTPVFPTFGAPSNNQMNMEDSMAEDTMQSSNPVASFGQPSPTPSGNFVFGGATPSFQFGGQQNTNLAGGAPPPQSPSPYQGGSFSLGTSGAGDNKTGRRMFKAKRLGKR
ncbi:hypothetical protein ACHQM5_013327 [Ranunculus cassubicifolius]